MEIKKEDLVKIRLFDGREYIAIRSDFLDEVEEAIEEVVEEIIEEVLPTPEELEAIAKAEKKAELLAQIALLEE